MSKGSRIRCSRPKLCFEYQRTGYLLEVWEIPLTFIRTAIKGSNCAIYLCLLGLACTIIRSRTHVCFSHRSIFPFQNSGRKRTIAPIWTGSCSSMDKSHRMFTWKDPALTYTHLTPVLLCDSARPSSPPVTLPAVELRKIFPGSPSAHLSYPR